MHEPLYLAGNCETASCSGDLSLEQWWRRAKQDLGTDKLTLEFSRDVIHKLTCLHCEHEEDSVCAGGLGKL